VYKSLWPQRNATLSLGSLIRRLYLCYFSQPAADRALFQAVRKHNVRSIVELGIGFGGRTSRLLELVAGQPGDAPRRYTGIDLFEARVGDVAKTSLKDAFAELRCPGVRVQLVPGDPATALRRVANELTSTDLLLISADQDQVSLSRGWTWIPRMLTSASLVFSEELNSQTNRRQWRRLKLGEIQALASQSAKTRRCAA
jgi:hypothetical protein